VHADPLNAEHPRYMEIHQRVMDEVVRDKRIANFHDLRILTTEKRLAASFDIAIEKEVSDDEGRAVKELLRGRLADKLLDVRIAIKVVPSHE
jgi:divalent metal cation (Fe/Co/Zn/Cd) transporter